MASPQKPSALSLNSPRASPFRRPSSASSPSTAHGRAAPSPMTSPSKLKQSFTPADHEEELPFRPPTLRSQTEPPLQSLTGPGLRRPSTPDSNATATPFSFTAASRNSRALAATAEQDNLSKLPHQLLHSMREAFSVLDHGNAGTISLADVMETLSGLGLQESNPGALFPPGQAQQLSLPQFLNQLANILVELSPQQELLNAFSAFDDDDSGQIEVAELRDALLHTAPEVGERTLSERDVTQALEGFTGRRVFAKNAVAIAGVRGLGLPGAGAAKKSGDVFRYQEFVGNLTGGAAAGNVNTQAGSVQV